VIGILQDITDRKQYEQEIQQRLQELDAIHTVSKAAASALEFNPLFDLVSTELFELFDIQEIYFALHDWETNEVRFPYYRRGDQRIETDAVPFGQGLSSRVIMTREPLLINQDYERRSAELGVVRFSQPKTSLNQVSWLGVPIRAGEQVIGMICMMNLVRENAFAQTDLVLLATIAANVGIAIRNAQLYMTAQQELTERKRVEVDLRKRESILEAITFSAEQFLMQPHWRKSINEVLERLGKEFNASHAYLFERHLGENGVNLSSLRYEWAAPGQTADIDNPDYQNMEEYETEFSRYYQTLDQGEPFVGSSSAFTDEEREYFASEGIKALLEMRITVNGQQWGALGFDDLVNEREWTAMEVDVLKVAANVLGAAIKRRSDEEMLKRELEERKRAQDDLQRRAQQLATLNEINRTVSELKNLDEVLEVIYQQTQRIASADAFYIALWDEQRNEVSYPIIYDLGMRYTESSQPLRSDSWIRQVLLTGQPYRLNRTEEELKVPASRTVGNEQRKSASILVIPLRQNKKILGVLSVQSYTMNAYSDEVVDILIGIGYQAAIAIENARLFTGMQQELAERKRAESALQKTTSRLELLHNIDRALLYAQSPEQIANEALSRIRQLIPSQRVSITLFDFEKNEARVAAANFDEDYFPSGRSFVTLEEYGQYIIDELLQDKPFRVDDVLTDSRAIELDKALAQKGFRSWLYLPLFSQGRLIGALNLARTGEIPFTAEEEAIGYEVANQLAIVLQQNRLLEALQTELSERKHMQEILFEEKERAEVTLYSIGDAVITTNEQAYVTYLNPVAESLLGWNMAEAAGEPLEKIFHVIEEGSRKPIASPVERCLQEGRIVGLPQHSILISRDGMEYAIDDSAAPIRNRQGETIGAVLVFHDVTEERRLLQQIAHDAMHDSLTGLVNRREFERRLEYALTSVQEHGLSHILCYLDMDQFKIVNDTAGHAAGDELLRQVVRLLRGTFRQRDTFARLGGDEFGLLLENCQLDQALVICNEIRTKIREIIFSWEGQNFQVRVSIGVVPINVNTESVTQLLSQADIACYSAKDLGRDRIHVYEIGDIETTRRYNEILQASRLRDAITNNQFRLYCQPISRLLGEETEFKHYEVLMRMMDTEEHLVMPGAFIPPAERYGLMPAIDRWVIRATLMAMSRHATQGMQFAINLSGTSLDDETLLEYVLEQIREFSIPPEQICFEITETAAIHHLNKAQQFIQAFRGQGGKISLDDFGSGFSSFRYLKSLPVDYLKIDGSFVHDMLSNRSDQVMVEAITLIAHTLNIGVIAEHASELEIITRLREIGVEYAQGMGIGIPIPMEEVWGKDSSPEG
jgi:diguanylate cyclase (GGDEF)-like protein/PAS domain S-box-containing protein